MKDLKRAEEQLKRAAERAKKSNKSRKEAFEKYMAAASKRHEAFCKKHEAWQQAEELHEAWLKASEAEEQKAWQKYEKSSQQAEKLEAMLEKKEQQAEKLEAIYEEKKQQAEAMAEEKQAAEAELAEAKKLAGFKIVCSELEEMLAEASEQAELAEEALASFAEKSREQQACFINSLHFEKCVFSLYSFYGKADASKQHGYKKQALLLAELKQLAGMAEALEAYKQALSDLAGFSAFELKAICNKAGLREEEQAADLLAEAAAAEASKLEEEQAELEEALASEEAASFAAESAGEIKAAIFEAMAAEESISEAEALSEEQLAGLLEKREEELANVEKALAGMKEELAGSFQSWLHTEEAEALKVYRKEHAEAMLKKQQAAEKASWHAEAMAESRAAGMAEEEAFEANYFSYNESNKAANEAEAACRYASIYKEIWLAFKHASK